MLNSELKKCLKSKLKCHLEHESETNFENPHSKELDRSIFKGHIEFLLKAIQNNIFIISQEEKSRFKKEYQSLLNPRDLWVLNRPH